MRHGAHPGTARLLGWCLLGACVSSIAHASWKDFIPTPYENAVFFEAFSSFERDHYTGVPTPTLWTDTFVRERLSLESNGYSYAPQFMQYQFSLGLILRQEDWENSQVEDDGWVYGDGFDYNVRLLFLPEHPYNLELFANRVEPLFRQQSSFEHDFVGQSYGGTLQYRARPYFLRAGFVDDITDSSESYSEVRRGNFGGEYFKHYTGGDELVFTANFSPQWFNASGGVDGTSYDYSLGNIVNLQEYRLSSNVTYQTLDQTSGLSGDLSSEQFAWTERGVAYLPWNLRSDLLWRYRDDESTVDDPGTLEAQKYDSRGHDLEFNLEHRLYQSLLSRYTLIHDTNANRGGDVSTLSNGVSANYTKVIPTGLFLLGGGAARAETDSNGNGADIVGEQHPAISVPTDIFTLNQPNIDEASIEVFYRSPLAPFELVLLTRDVHYAVRAVPNLNTYEIQVFSLPGDVIIPGSFDFFVNYSLLGGDFALRVDTLSGNLSLELFDHLVSPYVSYVRLQSDVLSGSFPGYAVDSTSYTAGLRFFLGPVRLRGEYQDLEWEVSPYDAWLGEVQYVDTFEPRLSVYGSASYLTKHYREGTLDYQPFGYTEDTLTVSGSVQKQFLMPSMYLSTGATFAQVNGLVDSRAYSLNGSWTWRLGKMDFVLGADGYFTESHSTQPVPLRRDHELIYVKLTRRLF